MTQRTTRILGAIAIFAVAFLLGSFVRVDRSSAMRALSEKVKAVRGPHFPAGDTTAIADLIRTRCKPLAADAQRKCYSAQLMALRSQRGTRFAMGALNRLATVDKDVEFGGHDYAHMMGITAYKTSNGDVAGAFKSCTEILQSGCYHGVIQTYFMSVPSVGATEVNAVCKEWSTPEADRWLRFQCVHGMGHGLTMFYEHDLPRALQGCDLLVDEWDRKSCYGGAFMENIIFATDPRMAHMVMDDDGDDAHGDAHAAAAPPAMPGMDMPGMTMAGGTKPKFKMIDSTDLSFPCSAVGERYQEDCWAMQPAVMLQLNGGDFTLAFRGCDKAPPARYGTCYAGTGTEISGATLRDHRKSIALCSLGRSAYQPWCYYGVVKNFIDVTAKSEDGLAFCKVVPGRANQLMCYQAVGEEIAVLRNTLEARRPLCEVVTGDAGALDACLFGAQILTSRPSGTPSSE